jgi:alkylation response protein AidB-like acyl-CoA dehydrogenase
VQASAIAQAVNDLLPGIRARRAEIERARRMPADLVESLRQAGIFRLAVPRALGGDEAKPTEIMRAIETVATADGSAGWCTMVAAGNNIAAGYMNERGAREVFADPTAPTTGIAAPAGAAVRENGGVRVNGRCRSPAVSRTPTGYGPAAWWWTMGVRV